MSKPKVVESYSRQEQETSANYCQGQWIIYSNRTPHVTKMLKQYPEAEILEVLESGVPALIKVVLDEDLISFRKPVSQEKRDQMSKLAKERFGK